MTRGTIPAIIFLVLFAIAGCKNSGQSGQNNPGGGIPTDQVVLTFVNAEENINYIGTRVNMITSEVYRLLDRLASVANLSASIQPLEIPGIPFSLGLNGFCDGPSSPGVEIIEYRDNDADDTLNAGDEVVFSYDTAGCQTSAAGTRSQIPGQLGGVAVFTFGAGTDTSSNTADNYTFVGSVEFVLYAYTDGLLYAGGGGDSEIIESGTVSFNIVFNGVDTSTATLAATSGVVLPTGNNDLAGPVLVTFDSITRTEIPNDVRVSIVNGSVASQSNAMRVDFATTMFGNATAELVGLNGNPPSAGAYTFTGGGGTSARVVSDPAAPNLTGAQIDIDGNGSYTDNIDGLPIPKHWDWLVNDFLIP